MGKPKKGAKAAEVEEGRYVLNREEMSLIPKIWFCRVVRL